jgi:hypothetical protein
MLKYRKKTGIEYVFMNLEKDTKISLALFIHAIAEKKDRFIQNNTSKTESAFFDIIDITISNIINVLKNNEMLNSYVASKKPLNVSVIR